MDGVGDSLNNAHPRHATVGVFRRSRDGLWTYVVPAGNKVYPSGDSFQTIACDHYSTRDLCRWW